MKKTYEKILTYIVKAGDDLATQEDVKDIGVRKKWLTEADIRIERELKKIVLEDNPDHDFYAEEENAKEPDAEHVWAVDPISNTRGYINGIGLYSVVVSHIYKKEVQFAAVYDPKRKELFTAYKGGGAFLNGDKIRISENVSDITAKQRVILSLSTGWKDTKTAQSVFRDLTKFWLFRKENSSAVNYCHAAVGRYEGALGLNKDNFPDYAGSLIIKEAGGFFETLDGKSEVGFKDRIFITGHPKVKAELKKTLKLIADS